MSIVALVELTDDGSRRARAVCRPRRSASPGRGRRCGLRTDPRNNGRSSGRKTVLFITHQIDEAVYLSDRVVVFSRRAGRISEIVAVDLPWPRPLSVKRSPEFVAYVERIWRLIEDDVRLSVLEEGGRVGWDLTAVFPGDGGGVE